MRLIGFTVLLAISVVFSLYGQPCWYSEVESNDSAGVADFITSIPGIGCMNGSISPVGDLDYYVFTVVTPTQVTIETLTPDDSEIRLMDEDGATIDQNDDVGSGQYRSRIIRNLSPGRYYVEVWEHGNDAEIHEYTLRVFAEGCGSEVEPNDYNPIADYIGSVPGELCMTGSIQYLGDVDYFVFQVPSTTSVTVSTITDGDTMIEVYSAESGDLVAENDDVAVGQLWSKVSVALEFGAYFVVVREYGDDDLIDSYSLLVSEVGNSLQPGQGVSFAQVEFTWAGAELPESSTGQIDIDVRHVLTSTGMRQGFVNVATSRGWVVQNLPISEDFPYDTISTRFHLSSAVGQNITVLEAYVEVSAEPLVTFESKGFVVFSVGNTTHNAQGHGEPLAVAPVLAPIPGAANFIAGGVVTACWQAGHTNVEAAHNQCAPAAAANSLDWLRQTYQLAIPHANTPGLVGCPVDSLVAQLDLAMVRKAGLTWPRPPAGAPAGLSNAASQRMSGGGVDDYEFLRGKLAYLANSGLGGLLLVEHQDDSFGALNATWCGDTSFGRGNPPTAQFIIDRVCRNADVEAGYTWDAGGGHMVNVVGAGRILGIPWIAHISDHDQSDGDLPPDLVDNNGTGGVDFTFLVDTDGDGLLNLIGETGLPDLDVAVSEEMQ